MESGTTHLLSMLKERISKLSDEGKWEEAMSASGTLVDKARECLSGGDMESLIQLAEALETRGDILRQYGYLEDARINYLEALEMLNGRVEFTEALARISASIGVLYDSVENDDDENEWNLVHADSSFGDDVEGILDTFINRSRKRKVIHASIDDVDAE